MKMRAPLSPACVFAILGSSLLGSGLLEAQAAIEPDLSNLDLDAINLYATGWARRGGADVQFPLGWSGTDEATGTTLEAVGEVNGRPAILHHCPWRGGTGIAFQQFLVRFPHSATRIRLRGSTALRPEVIGKTDGVVFRVFAGSRKLLEKLRTADAWEDFDFDLTADAGSEVTIRFETDPGAADDTTYDHALWAGRALVFEGFEPPALELPTPPPLDLARVRVTGAEVDPAPRSGFDGTREILLANGVASFRYEGGDGTLEYRWKRPTAAEPLFGELSLNARMAGEAVEDAVDVPLAGSSRMSWTSTATPMGSAFARTADGVRLTRTFLVGELTTTVRIEGNLVGKSLVLRVSAQPSPVSLLDAGVWGPVFRKRPVTVPYYSGRVHFLPHENLFTGVFLDWTASSATSIDASKAYYAALTDGTRSALSERVVYTAAWHLAEVLPDIPNPPSPWREDLAPRVMLDIWGGRFADIAQGLEALADLGPASYAAIVHAWQRSGYDNALPLHIPANADLGGDTAMASLVGTGNRLGIPVALHENYVDYYPNYDFFDPADIALDSSGNPILAWFNPGTGIQSFAVKPNSILRLAATQSPEIHRRYGTQANYLDVHSAVPPWFHVDQRAGETGAGTFRRVWDTHRELWAYERETHGGPVFGEGATHWFWSGWLDGVEAQFGWDPEGGASANQGFTAPLAVDFDLLKVHPLQVNHGMGYYERWWPKDFESNLAGPPPMAILDRYRMQEVAFGHAGFLSGSTWSVLPLAWLESNLVSPVSERYATRAVAEIRYEDQGLWIDASAVERTGAARDRVRVLYEGGLSIVANGRAEPLAVDSWLLPESGWLVRGAGVVSAGTVIRDGVIVDFADTGDSVFANARNATDWQLSTLRRVRPRVGSFTRTAPRTFRATYRWEIGDTLPKDYAAFVHFTLEDEIRWQQDHALSVRTTEWVPGTTFIDGSHAISVPTAIPDGDYDWLIGLWFPATGERVRCLGVDVGASRIRLGVLHLRDSGSTVEFSPEAGEGPDPTALYREHLNLENRIVDFGDLRTDGSVRVRREGGDWVLRPWPRERAFTLELDGARFGRPALVRTSGASSTQVIPIPSGESWRLPIDGSKEYRWTSHTNFRRGDPNGDGEGDISDGISILSFLFLGLEEPGCLDSADTNDDGSVDLSDAVYLLNWLFLGGPSPTAPLDECGGDPTPDSLGCEEFHC